MEVGKSKLLAGSQAFAMSEAEGILTLAPSVAAPARAKVAIDDTNFKEVMRKVYEDWKDQRVRVARAQHEHALDRRDEARQTADSGDEIEPEGAGDRPEQAADGSVPVMEESMRRGEVTEVSADMVKEWGLIEAEEIDGVPYWTATVTYSTLTIFGEFPVEAQALMRHGKVKKWVYTGSREVVP